MKKIVNISLIASLTITSLVASDSISEAFTNGEFQGSLKSYYFQENQKDTGKSAIINNGGSVNYKTDEYLDLKAGATFQFSSTANINGTNRFAYDEEASGAVLSESYLSYSKDNSTFKIGRQFIGTPLLAGSGSRMIRQSFQGYTFNNTDFNQTKIFAAYVDRFQGRTDTKGNPGKFSKTFNTNSALYERELKKGAYTLYLQNTSIPNLTLDLQYLKAVDNFATSYLVANYNLDSFFVAGQYIGTSYDTNDKNGNFFAGRIGANHKNFSIVLSASKNNSDETVESGLGYGADTSFTGNEIYGGVFSYIKGSEAFQVKLGTKISDIDLNLIHTYTDLKYNKSNDRETDLILSYNYSKNLNISFLHAIINGTEDYSRANAENESRLKINYTF